MVEQAYKSAQRQAELIRFIILKREATDPLAIGLISEIVSELEADEAHQLQPSHPATEGKWKG